MRRPADPMAGKCAKLKREVLRLIALVLVLHGGPGASLAVMLRAPAAAPGECARAPALEASGLTPIN